MPDAPARAKAACSLLASGSRGVPTIIFCSRFFISPLRSAVAGDPPAPGDLPFGGVRPSAGEGHTRCKGRHEGSGLSSSRSSPVYGSVGSRSDGLQHMLVVPIEAPGCCGPDPFERLEKQDPATGQAVETPEAFTQPGVGLVMATVLQPGPQIPHRLKQLLARTK
jgi:hypothetical protein